jgi:hypothetical protein
MSGGRTSRGGWLITEGGYDSYGNVEGDKGLEGYTAVLSMSLAGEGALKFLIIRF